MDCCHFRNKTFEKVITVLRAGTGFGVVLNRKDRAVGHADTAVRAIKERNMGFDDTLWKRLTVDGKAVIHRSDFHLAGFKVLDRVVGPVMTVVHLDRFGAQCQRKHLVAKTNSEDRQIRGVEDRADHWDRIGACCGWIAGTVGQENAIGIMGQNLLGRGGCRKDSHVATRRGEAAQNIALGAIVEGDNLETRFCSICVTLGPCPPLFIPLIGLRAGHFAGQIKAFEAAEGAGAGDQIFDVKIAVGIMGQGCVRGALLPDRAGQAARVNAADTDAAALAQPFSQFLRRAPVRWFRRVPFDNHALGHRFGAFVIFGGDAGIADMREGESHDLTGIRGVGHDLLIAGHCGIETQFGHLGAGGAEPLSVKNRSISQSHASGWFFGDFPDGHRRDSLGQTCRKLWGLERWVKGSRAGSAHFRKRFHFRRLGVFQAVVMARCIGYCRNLGLMGMRLPMDMKQRVSTALKDAMKAKDVIRLSTLRLINAAIKDKDIALRGEGAEVTVSDDEVLQILSKMVKQRQESARAYDEGGRFDLAERERSEISVIEGFLPRKLSEDETASAINDAISDTGAASIRDMGKVMAELKGKYTGQMDFGQVGPKVRQQLG